MNKFIIFLKNGRSFDVDCENIRVKYSTITGEATSFNYEGCTHNAPIFLDVTQIAAVVQVEVGNG